ncbi:MAG TPA: S9 family peptidase [Longimicrobiales bacterium]|nr:S9 family peptidase [Longimicrobiales bacterium]
MTERTSIRPAGRTMAGFAAFLLLQGVTAPLGAQLTVEQIFSTEYAAGTPSVTYSPDGRHLTSLVRSNSLIDVWIERVGGAAERLVDGATLIPEGESGPVIIEEFTWSRDGSRALIFANSQRVWRRNTKGTYYVWDRASGRTVPVSRAGGLQSFATFSPDAQRVAWVRDSDIWVSDPFAGRELRLTQDGGGDIINGTTDWVHEEELDLSHAFRWSPDGQRIAFWRFDQSPIEPFLMLDELQLYPGLVPVRYPKAGTPNSIVDIRIIDIASGRITTVETGSDPDVYLARMEWAGNDELIIQRLNRGQNRIDVLLAEAVSGRSRAIFAETDNAWVDVDDDLTWIRDGRQFLWTSERDGFNHIYLFNRDGSTVRQLTSGEWDVRDLVGVSEGAGRVWFTSSERGPLEKQLYTVDLNGRGMRRVSTGEGWHDVVLAADGRSYIDTHSRTGSPPVTTLHSADGRPIRVIADNAVLAARLQQHQLGTHVFFQFATTDSVTLNGWMIRPPDFDATRRYPVLMYVYGGPGSQTVTDAWGGSRWLWHQLLAQQGMVIVSIDNRGTGGRGAAFRKIVHRNLGHSETQDQIEGARWLATQPWVDASRIGIWGWSYGGFMTALSMMSSDVFRAGIAVAPVTDWRLYDTIYTERFMARPAENPEGYDKSSAILKAAELSGRLFLIHGTGDDNVHFQNTLRLTNALQDARKQFDLMVYANRTHSLTGGETPRHHFEAMTEWVLRYLRN